MTRVSDVMTTPVVTGQQGHLVSQGDLLSALACPE